MALNSTWDFSRSSQLDYNGRAGVNQAIEKRSGLLFNYAQTSRGAATMKRWLPFYENPQIVESRKANYASTDIFLRNEPVRLYTGADARQFRVEIHYTLIHMASMVPTSEILKIFSNDKFLDDKEIEAIENYVKAVILADTGSKGLVEGGGNAMQLARAVQAINGTPNVTTAPNNPYSNKYPNESLDMDALNSIANKQRGLAATLLEEFGARDINGLAGPYGNLPNNISSQWNDALIYTMGTQSGYTKLTALLQYVMNHIRNSVIGSGEVSVKGPPIVQLKHGAMYDFVPCIVKDYRLQPVEEAGYDTKSLFSQRLKVSLTLEEMRNVHGNSFGDPSVTGSLPGWENVLISGRFTNPIPEYRPSQFF
tara:strand:+ start:14740 stop:15840 length:1101 start_codon:yes stop_codon:yes gene_type:complete